MLTTLRKYRWLLEPTIAVVFFVLWMIAESGRIGNAPLPLFPLVVAVLAASMGVARRLPWLAIAIPGAVILLQLLEPAARLDDNSWPVYLSILITCLIVSVGAAGNVRWVVLPVSISYAIMVAVLLAVPALSDGYGWGAWVGTPSIPADKTAIVLAAYFSAFAVATWSLGFALGSSRLRRAVALKFESTVEELHSAEIDLIVSRERDRIAQDVHDVMAHSLAVIIAQADGARFIGTKRPEAIGDSLEQIASSARSSLSEVRILIESLVSEPEGHSNPTIENLDELVERMRGAGLTATIENFGFPRSLTPGQQLAVYRIAQEALTNALKHAGREPSARITMDWRGPGLALSISSTGTLVTPDEAGDSNSRMTRGLYGMRERARLAGGWLTSGADDESGDYLVTAFIPSTGDAETATGEHAEKPLLAEEAAAL
ncbi:histidine kinase [Rhodoglobus sp. NPDC076762]